MADIFSREKRSEVMKAVKSKNTKTTELKLIKIFKELHISGWRRTYPMKGKPDFVFPKKRVVVFVDGCFWHGHDCRNIIPKENSDFWEKKRRYNKSHDEEVTKTLIAKGWNVIRIWECELKKKNRENLYRKLEFLIKK
ncbi:MAG: very short patch repair endonuclease [Clostridiales bacterium]|nr:very short patch repair endonuclease [Clostridiales bacterium]